MSYLSCADRITGTKRPAVDYEEEMPRSKDPTEPPKKAVGRKVPVVTINEYQIFSDEMARLRNGVEINATIVYAMSTLIRQKMKNDVCGFVDQKELSKPSYGGMFSGGNEGKTGIQIHNNDVHGHFLTSSFNQSDKVVRLWDSLAKPLSQNLQLQLFSLYGSGKDSIQYTYESVRKQYNLVNCGVHAIVFAHDLAVDGGVSSFYVGKELRTWTEVCLMRREISIPQRRPEHSAARVSILVGGTITKQWFDQNSDRIELAHS